MENLLICKNPVCRYLIDLREGGTLLSPSELIVSVCPECGHNWSSCCPFCGNTLGVVWWAKNPRCSSCHRTLRPEICQGDHVATGTRGKLRTGIPSVRSRGTITSTRPHSRLRTSM